MEKKNLNMKNIKAEMEFLYQRYVNSDYKDDSYHLFYDTLRNLWVFNFISRPDFNKIYDYDSELFTKYSK